MNLARQILGIKNNQMLIGIFVFLIAMISYVFGFEDVSYLIFVVLAIVLFWLLDRANSNDIDVFFTRIRTAKRLGALLKETYPDIDFVGRAIPIDKSKFSFPTRTPIDNINVNEADISKLTGCECAINESREGNAIILIGFDNDPMV